MKAIKSVAIGRSQLVEAVPIPSLKGHKGFPLVKVACSGLNPADYLCTDIPFMYIPNSTFACDFSGTVVAVHSAVTKFKKGERVAGYVYPQHLTAPDGGCHAEHALVKAGAQNDPAAVGDALSTEQFATLGAALATACMGLYAHMRLQWPGSAFHTPAPRNKTLFIYGGSTSTGMMAIQFAKLSGMIVLTTCSPNNTDILRSLGADHVFDNQNVQECVSQIHEIAGDSLNLVFDCIGAIDSPKVCATVLSSTGGVYCAITPPTLEREDVQVSFVQGQVALGEPLRFSGKTIPGDQEPFELGKRFMSLAERLLAEGKIKPPPVEIIEWLEKIPGIQVLRQWKLRAKQYVCRVSSD